MISLRSDIAANRASFGIIGEKLGPRWTLLAITGKRLHPEDDSPRLQQGSHSQEMANTRMIVNLSTA